MAHLYNSTLELIYEEQILDNKRSYSQSWGKVLHFLIDDRQLLNPQHRGSLDMGQQVNMKLKDKDRQNIKDKFYVSASLSV